MTEFDRLIYSGSFRVPPSANQLYRRGQSGGVYRTKKYQKWREDAALVLRNAMGTVCHRIVDAGIAPPVRVHIAMNINSRHDIANREKGIMDALQDAGVIANDWQVSEMTLVRSETLDFERFIVEVYI